MGNEDEEIFEKCGYPEDTRTEADIISDEVERIKQEIESDYKSESLNDFANEVSKMTISAIEFEIETREERLRIPLHELMILKEAKRQYRINKNKCRE